MRGILVAITIVSAVAQGVAAEGDAAAGEKVFKKCAACHAVDEGKKKIGPTMFGVWGRKAGAVEGFNYSTSMGQAGFVWDEEHLSGFLASPKKYLPGTKMSFPGIKKPEQILDLLAYLESLQ